MKKNITIIALGLVFAYPNLDMLRNESKLIGDYAIVFVKNEITLQQAVYVFEYKKECKGIIITPKDGGDGCWELVGLPDENILYLLKIKQESIFK